MTADVNVKQADTDFLEEIDEIMEDTMVRPKQSIIARATQNSLVMFGLKKSNVRA